MNNVFALKALTQEQQAVLLCCRYPMDDEAIQSVNQLIAQGLDWDRFFKLAHALNVVPLVAGNLFRHFQEKLEETVAERLRQLRYGAMIRCVQMERRLREVAGWFKEEGIPLLVFKGLPLGVLLYDSPLLRLTGDVDVMVHREDVKRVWQMLKGRGFRPSYDLDERQQEALLWKGFAHDFNSPDASPAVDLHWDMPRYLCPMNAEKAWMRSVEVNIEGNLYRTFSREDYLLFLGYHPVKHCYGDLRAICDIAAVLRGADHLDWDYIGRESRQSGYVVWLALRLAETLFGSSLPPSIRQQVHASSRVEELERTVCTGLFQSDGRSVSRFRNNPTLWGSQVLDKKHRRLSFLMSKLFVPNEEEFSVLSLPKSMFYLYYGVRLCRLPWRYAGIVRRLRR